VFLSEVREILSLDPGLEGELYFADSALYGPYPYSRKIGPPTVPREVRLLFRRVMQLACLDRETLHLHGCIWNQ
jgi:hypothetical protein